MGDTSLLQKYPALHQVLSDLGLPDTEALPIVELTHTKIEQLRKVSDPISEQQEQELLKSLQQLHKGEIEYIRNLETVLKVHTNYKFFFPL